MKWREDKAPDVGRISPGQRLDGSCKWDGGGDGRVICHGPGLAVGCPMVAPAAAIAVARSRVLATHLVGVPMG